MNGKVHILLTTVIFRFACLKTQRLCPDQVKPTYPLFTELALSCTESQELGNHHATIMLYKLRDKLNFFSLLP